MGEGVLGDRFEIIITWWTGTFEFIDQVFTHASILTGAGLTLVDIFFTNCSCVSYKYNNTFRLINVPKY